VPFAILLLTAFTCTYWILSSEHFFERIHEEAYARATTEEQREALNNAREATELALASESAKIYFGVHVAWVVGRSFVVLLLSCWLLLSWISSRWDLFLPSYLSWLSVSGVLSLGFIIHTIIQLVLHEQTINIGPALLFEPVDKSDSLYSVLTRIDLFTLLFLWATSIRWSNIYGESKWAVFFITCSTVVVLALLSMLLDIQFFLFNI
jgi:hypothetical protein